MGSKLEKAHEGIERTQEEINEAVDEANDDADEMDEVREALSGVPEDTDDDIHILKEQVEKSAVSEAVSDMESDVKGSLESGEKTGEEVSQEAQVDEENVRQAAAAYGEVSNKRFAGEAADAQSQAESRAEDFVEVQDDAERITDEGKSEYEELLQRIEG